MPNGSQTVCQAYTRRADRPGRGGDGSLDMVLGMVRPLGSEDLGLAGLSLGHGPGEATDDIVLILLDQNSLDWASRENGLTWPWPRELYGAIADYCRRAGAKALAFDVLFSEPSTYGVGRRPDFGCGHG